MNLRIISRMFALLVVASGFVSFKPNASNKKMVGSWFEYIGPQTGNPATLSDARTRLNYQITPSAPSTSASGNLIAIFVQQSEIDNNGSPGDPTDDMPMVDVSSTDGYIALGLAKDPSTGQWSDTTYNTATVVTGSLP